MCSSLSVCTYVLLLGIRFVFITVTVTPLAMAQLGFGLRGLLRWTRLCKPWPDRVRAKLVSLLGLICVQAMMKEIKRY